MQNYEPKEIEEKWQKEWSNSGIYQAKKESTKKNYYVLMEFPFPSGDGLHAGHVRGYTGMDIVARKRRMEGYNVLFPIGYDAFGLPTENFALKNKKNPALVTRENCLNFEKQFIKLGMSFDWSREINTTDPNYYKWTQWLFLKFFENNLAYKARIPINWCPKCKIGLANEEVVNDSCERCGSKVLKKEKEQWMLKITKYADRLINDLENLDYPDRVKAQQVNWIGRSDGEEIDFPISNTDYSIKIFTTRPDTIYGATYIVLAPEHELIEKLSIHIKNIDEVRRYAEDVKNKTDIDRNAEGREKSGILLGGIVAKNPASKNDIPVYVADYVLPSYGTGAIMAVPSDDERDREFAENYNLPIIKNYPRANFEEFGKKTTKFKLRDWVFSRQRYWGEPIPVIHCDKCGIVAVPDSDLPVKLPDIDIYEPTATGESPLANIKEFVDTRCPKCAGDAKRETDVMPNWAGSSWYFLSYLFDKDFFDGPVSTKDWMKGFDNLVKFMPVNWYNGGMEHTVLHLLYSRFWNKFFFDLGLVPTLEPYTKRTSHGLILAKNGEKMSKSKGNVVNPDLIIDIYGADSLRVYEMFMGPFEQEIAWNEDAIIGARRFLEKIWRIREKISSDEGKSVGSILHKTIIKVNKGIEELGFNTSVSSLMLLSNEMDKLPRVLKDEYAILIKLLAPFAPHIAEDLWHLIGETESIHISSWPQPDETKLSDKEITIVIQVNGKVRGSFVADAKLQEAEVIAKAIENQEVTKWISDKKIKKTFYVPGKLVNLVLE